jgi:serine/threonine protein kinase
MSTYSLEEVEDLGLCIVAEWIEGVTLGKWLLTKPSLAARRRVLMQILDALAYIHSLQLVHHDIKLDNIMITTNGSNVKLIDFGLSNTDDTVLTESNDVRKDIVGVGKIMKRMFASSGLLSLFSIQRYPITTRCCLQGKYENIASLRKAFLRRNVVAKWLYALLLVVLVLLCAALINDRVKEKVKKQEMLEYVKNQVDIDISKIYALVESKNTYFDAIQVLHAIDVISKRDSLVSLYADDPASAIFVGSVWDQYFVPKYNQLIQELSTNRTKWPYPTY